MKLINENSNIVNCDLYKPSHYLQIPEDTEDTEHYIAPRRGENICFMGLQAHLKKFFVTPITKVDIEEGRELIQECGLPFNGDGWNYILNKHGGYLPLTIDAIPEGTVHGPNIMQVRVKNSFPKIVPWLGGYVETALLRVHHPTGISSLSFAIKRLIKKYMEETCDDISGLPYKLVDFGARACSGPEQAGFGSIGHLPHFAATDTLSGIIYAKNYYNARDQVVAGSIPAGEHGTYTLWGKEGEVDAYRNMLKHFGGKDRMFAAVSDTYDLYNAVENIWGGILREEVIASGATVVIRPDSGHPATVVLKTMELLDMKYGHTLNSKGYRVLNNMRVIQGDGINYDSIHEILELLKLNDYSIDNVAFGMGGGLHSGTNRDTYGYAMKACAVRRSGVWNDAFKDPATDPGKSSKRGRQETLMSEDGKSFMTVPLDLLEDHVLKDKSGKLAKPALRRVYENGQLLIDENFQTIRDRAASYL